MTVVHYDGMWFVIHTNNVSQIFQLIAKLCNGYYFDYSLAITVSFSLILFDLVMFVHCIDNNFVFIYFRPSQKLESLIAIHLICIFYLHICIEPLSSGFPRCGASMSIHFSPSHYRYPKFIIRVPLIRWTGQLLFIQVLINKKLVFELQFEVH